MMTVPEVAKRIGKHPETIRRWIREGKLPATKIGTQHVIDEDDLANLVEPGAETASVPLEWQRTQWGDPMPDIVAVIRQSRAERSSRLAESVAAYASSLSAPPRASEPVDLWLPAIVGRIVRLVDPARIILFGSRARGPAQEDSDYDLLIVLDAIEDRYETRIAIHRTLADLPIGKDIVLATSQEVGWAPTMIGDILRTAVLTGRTIYERPDTA